MLLETRIRIEAHDMASVGKLEQAFNLVGGHALPEDDKKPFGRIRGNNFSFSDAQAAVAAIKKRTDDLLHEANSNEIFLDPQLQALWAEGVRGTAELATRLASEFMDDLREDMAAIAG